VGLAGARPTDENYVGGARHELASMQLVTLPTTSIQRDLDSGG
jgi:hypothetical protein